MNPLLYEEEELMHVYAGRYIKPTAVCVLQSVSSP